MHPEQTVSEMVKEVLRNQAIALVERTGQTFESALVMISDTETEACRKLVELTSGSHRGERAGEWQEGLLRECTERLVEHFGVTGPAVGWSSGASPAAELERHYSWLEGYLGWLRGKEERDEYYSLLEHKLGNLKG